MIVLKNVTKRYRTRRVETTAVNALDLEVRTGDFLSVTGPSGSGKSTLITLLGLLERPDDGQIFFKGENVSRASANKLADLRRGSIGFVFQAFHLIPDLDVISNVSLGLEGLVGKRENREAAALAALDELGLSARARHMPSQLSGGQQQRVAIARAMVKKPDLLICDEPTGNLDRGAGDTVLDLIRGLHTNGTTVLLVTHDLDVAARAERQLVIDNGRLLSDTA